MGLFKPDWKTYDESKTDKALRAVEKETNQTKLLEIAKNAPLDRVRLVAVRKLVDQAALADVAKNAIDHTLRLAVAEKLVDQAALADVAKNAKDSDVQLAAAEKLTDQAVAQKIFADLAKNVTECNVRLAAVRKLVDQVVLADVAKNDSYSYVRLAAAEKLTDQAVAQKIFADVAKNDDFSYGRLAAAEKLIDRALAQKITAEIAKNKKEIEEKSAKTFDDLAAVKALLGSDGFRNEVERAKHARDQADQDRWISMGAPGAGKTHRCCLCSIETYGEETVIKEQQYALMRGDTYYAQRIEQKSAYRCKSCGKEYCKDCLEKKAPGNAYGGKSCPSCSGLFEIVHG